MANEVYMVHGILLPGGALLSQLTSVSPDTNSDLLTGYASGHAYPLFRAIREQSPEFPFSSEAISTVLAAITAGGNNYALDLSAGNTDLQCRQAQDLGVRYAPAVAQHERLRMSRAMLMWESISGNYNGDAGINCRLVGTYDGVNAAVQNVGTLRVSDEFFVGYRNYYGSLGKAYYELNAGAVIANTEVIGSDDTDAVFRQTGGTHDVGTLTVMPTGRYEFIGGTLACFMTACVAGVLTHA